MKIFDDYEEGGVFRQGKRYRYEGDQKVRLIRKRVDTPIATKRRWNDDPPLMVAREMIAESELKLEIQGELIAEVSQMKPSSLERLITSGELNRKIEAVR